MNESSVEFYAESSEEVQEHVEKPEENVTVPSKQPTGGEKEQPRAKEEKPNYSFVSLIIMVILVTIAGLVYYFRFYKKK